MKLSQAILTLTLIPLLTISPVSYTQAEDDWDDSGLDWGDNWEDDQASQSPWQVNSFIEGAYGKFQHNNPARHDESLMEIRAQLSANRYIGNHFFSSKLEFIADDVDSHTYQLEARELLFDLNLTDTLNLRAGQQILTWGTGDFVFLNDFFPKDWQAMFAGRDDNYLKAPSLSIKATLYNPVLNTDIVWTPDFTGDNFISGERFAYFNPSTGAITAAPPRVKAREPSSRFNHGQFALRLYREHQGIEYAIYGYRGFYTQPLGFDPERGVNTYPRLNSLGSSIRSPWLGGIANMELAYWDSRDDKDGKNPLVPNSQFNLLLGFEREIATNLTLGLQALLQHMQDYKAAEKYSPQPQYLVDEDHLTLTTRLTYLALQQKLTWSVFVFYSPDTQDYYLKPKVSYRHDDHWLFVVGSNQFAGDDNFTQWGQFEKSSNWYARMRYSF